MKIPLILTARCPDAAGWRRRLVWWKSDAELLVNLRRDGVFHYGKPVTADDVIWSMKRHMATGAKTKMRLVPSRPESSATTHGLSTAVALRSDLLWP